MKFLFLLLFTLFACSSYSQNNPLTATTNTLDAVRLLKYGNKSATSFVVSHQGNQYLITARHVFSGVPNGSTVRFELFNTGSFNAYSYPIYYHKDSTVDIAVIELHPNFFLYNKLTLASNNTNLGQECYFLGYPLGLGTWYKFNYYPIYKKATMSGFLNTASGLLAFDAHNNQGFSGAPIFTTNQGIEQQYLLAVVSGYAYENKTTEIKSKKKRKSQSVTYAENSGIMYAYDASKINEIIKINGL